MYGTGVGTGAAGTTMGAGVMLGSWTLAAVAGIVLVAMIVTLWRNGRRRGAHQRP